MHLIDRKPYLRKIALTLTIAAGTLTACQEAPPAVPAAEPAEMQESASTCNDRGSLQATFSGAIVAQLDWLDDALQCESMPRPDAEGVRLRFSGDVGEERLVIILAFPGLRAGTAGKEFDSNVTISVEGSGRFFSTPNIDTCWTDVASNEAIEGNSGIYNVRGELTCVGPLGEINGDGFVDIRTLRFSGIATWSTK